MTKGIAGAPGAAPAGSPMGSPGPAPAPMGPCECRFEDFCTCGGALAYIDCIAKTCAKEECNCGNNTVQFATSCGHMASECKEDLDIDCSGSHATCEGKFNQAENGIIGVTMDFDKIESEAYCGPTGRCAGTVQAAVKVHKPAKGVRVSCALEPRQGNTLVLNQDHSLRKPVPKLDGKALHFAIEKEEPETSKVVKEEKKEKEESLEEKKRKAASPMRHGKMKKEEDEEDSKESESKDGKKEEEKETDVGNQEHFGVTGLSAHEKGLLTCSSKVESEDAVCTMDMPPRLKPEGDIEGLCRLVDESNDEIITKDAWFVIKNAYNAPKVEAKPKKMALSEHYPSRALSFQWSLMERIITRISSRPWLQ